MKMRIGKDEYIVFYKMGPNKNPTGGQGVESLNALTQNNNLKFEKGISHETTSP